MDYITQDSGERQQFDSGMVRDTDAGKPRFDLLIPEGQPIADTMIGRWAALMARGAEKYAARNWEKAGSREELERFRGSAFRHFMQWFTGETDEDHAAAVLFNINGAEYVRQRLQNQTPFGGAEATPRHQPRVYIAGPITKGDLHHNIQQADDAMLALMQAGCSPFNPMLSVYAGGARRIAPPGALMEVVAAAHAQANAGFRDMTRDDWLNMDFAWVEASNALLRLPGESVGADAEAAYAKHCGIPVFDSVQAVLDHYNLVAAETL